MRKYVIYAGTTLATVLGSASASAQQAQPTELTMEPPHGVVVTWGSGYDSMRDQWVPAPCVSMPSGRLPGFAQEGGSQSWVVANDQEDVSNAFNLSYSASLKASMGVASFSASDKGSYVSSLKTGHQSQTIIGSWTNYDSGTIVDPNSGPGITMDLNRWKDPQSFRAACGDYMITGIQTGREIYGTMMFDASTTEQMNKIANDPSADFSYGMVHASASAQIENLAKSSSSQSSLQVKMFSNDHAPLATTTADFIKVMQDFANGKGASPQKPVVLVMVQPYAAVVANYPQAWIPNPLVESTPQMIQDLTQVAWELSALVGDSQHVVDNSNVHVPDAQNILAHNLYALGISDAKRNQRLNFMRQRNQYYRQQLTQLQHDFAANGCQNGASGAWPQACIDLHTKWQSFDPNAEYEQFPLPYASACYTGVALAGVPVPVGSNGHQQPGSANIEHAFFPRQTGAPLPQPPLGNDDAVQGPYDFPLTNRSRGDEEMGGGPVNVRASILFGIDMAGKGSTDEATNLLATLNIIAEEAKDDHSTYQHFETKPVFYLNGNQGMPPAPGSSLLGTYGECAFRHGGTGVKLGLRDGLHGHLSGMSGKDPRGFANYRGDQWGDITSVSCQVDSGAHNDAPYMACNGATFEDVQLDLVDKEDEAAENWQPPPPANDGRIPMIAVRHAVPGRDLFLTHGVPKVTQHRAPAVSCQANSHPIMTARGQVCAPNAVRALPGGRNVITNPGVIRSVLP